jgi:hypothetical protein
MFICDPHLPHRAVITAVRFSLFDPGTNSQVQNCALGRHRLTLSGMGNIEVMAAVAPTGNSQAPGFTRRTDTTIDFATVDNNQYAYWLQCQTTSAAPGIYGASVQYRIDPANG